MQVCVCVWAHAQNQRVIFGKTIKGQGKRCRSSVIWEKGQTTNQCLSVKQSKLLLQDCPNGTKNIYFFPFPGFSITVIFSSFCPSVVSCHSLCWRLREINMKKSHGQKIQNQFSVWDHFATGMILVAKYIQYTSVTLEN